MAMTLRNVCIDFSAFDSYLRYVDRKQTLLASGNVENRYWERS